MTRSATRHVRKPLARRSLAVLLAALVAVPLLALRGGDPAGAATASTMRISVTPSKRTIYQGQSTPFSIRVIRSSRFKSRVSLTTSKLPSGVTASFGARTIQSSTTVRFRFRNTVRAGTYRFTITGSGGGRKSSSTVSVVLLRGAPPEEEELTEEELTQDTLPPVGGVPGLPAATTTTVAAAPQPTTTVGASLLPTTTTAAVGPTTTTTLSVGPDFTLAAQPTSQTVPSGGNATYAIAVNRTGGYANPVMLTANGLPNGAAAAFDQNPVAGNSATLTVVTQPGIAIGTYPFTVTSFSRSVSLQLVVGTSGTTAGSTGGSTSTGEFSLAANVASQSVAAGSPATYAVSVNRIPSFATPVTLAVTGLPAGATAGFSPNPVTANSSVLTVATTAVTPAGTFPLTISGVGGSASATLNVSLVVGGGSGSPGVGSANSGPGDPVVTITPALQTVAPGASTTFNLALSAAPGVAIQPLVFAIGGMPVGVTAGMTANPTNSAAQLSIVTAASTPPGSYPLTITGTGGGVTRAVTITLVVGAGGTGGTGATSPDFQLSAVPTARPIPAGTANTYAITIAASGGFASPVTFATGSSSVNITANVTPNPATGTATLTVNVLPNTPPGNYSVTVSGTGGGITRALAVTVTV